MGWTKEQIDQAVASFRGAECLYLDVPLIEHARVSEASTSGDRVKVVLEVLPSAGFPACPGERRSVSFRWDNLSEDLTSMTSPWVGMFLYLDQELVCDAVNFTAALAPLPEPPWDLATMKSRCAEIAEFVNRREWELLSARTACNSSYHGCQPPAKDSQ